MLKGLCNSEIRVIFQGLQCDKSSCIVSYAEVRKMMEQGCRTFMASLVSSSEEQVKLVSIMVVSEFLDIFSKVLLGIPPPREVKFTIDVAPCTKPISKTPYQMASIELKELKDHLEELLKDRFICPSTSPWGTPVLFVKKKDGSLYLCI